MSSVRPTSFSRPDFLPRLKSSSIHLLLAPYANYLAARGITLPETIPPEFDFTELALVLGDHNQNTPTQLVDEMELLEMFVANKTLALDDDHAEILSRVREPDDTPDDIAIKILRQDSRIVWREFDRRAVQQKRSFVKYSVTPFMVLSDPTDDRMERLAELWAPWFDKEGKSNYCRVRYQPNANGFTLLVRHGDPLNRLGVIDDTGAACSTLLRPESLDLIHFKRLEREWLISGRGPRVKELYRQGLGVVFHGSKEAIAPHERFTLDPLLEGKDCLNPPKDGLITHIRLAGVVMESTCSQRHAVTRGDVFSTMQRLKGEEHTLTSATFALRLVGRRTQVKFTISPSENVISGTVNIPAVEVWLRETGFSLQADVGAILETA
jgi:hypothetical protein